MSHQCTQNIGEQYRAYCYHHHRHRETGELKGDALVSYLKQPSVALAVQLLDGTYFRADSKTPMMVGWKFVCVQRFVFFVFLWGGGALLWA